MTKARDIMNGLEPIGPQETIEAAAHKMTELHVDALPICDPSGNLQTMQGMITDGDITQRVVAKGRDPARTRVGELPQRDTGTIGADDPVTAAVGTMAQHDIGRLPVIEGFRVVGVIDKADVEQVLPGLES